MSLPVRLPKDVTGRIRHRLNVRIQDGKFGWDFVESDDPQVTRLLLALSSLDALTIVSAIQTNWPKDLVEIALKEALATASDWQRPVVVALIVLLSFPAEVEDNLLSIYRERDFRLAQAFMSALAVRNFLKKEV